MGNINCITSYYFVKSSSLYQTPKQALLAHPAPDLPGGRARLLELGVCRRQLLAHELPGLRAEEVMVLVEDPPAADVHQVGHLRRHDAGRRVAHRQAGSGPDGQAATALEAEGQQRHRKAVVRFSVNSKCWRVRVLVGGGHGQGELGVMRVAGVVAVRDHLLDNLRSRRVRKSQRFNLVAICLRLTYTTIKLPELEWGSAAVTAEANSG